MADQIGSHSFVRLTRFETQIHLVSQVVFDMLKTQNRGDSTPFTTSSTHNT